MKPSLLKSLAVYVHKDYPLARYLFLYVNKKPGEKLDPLRGEFLRFVLCKEGQEVVIKTATRPCRPPSRWRNCANSV